MEIKIQIIDNGYIVSTDHPTCDGTPSEPIYIPTPALVKALCDAVLKNWVEEMEEISAETARDIVDDIEAWKRGKLQ